ncbi:hypothetical protein BTO06_00935 [Tenacibaculum sp. SZ-18]|uniref:hypothetical protein n=1 Tax=Tenacibaculum sp. SZ-18 TaxID=754423 RepID=UPI000C2D15AA|nr:hypothetical protein [Tenacibaculum sp. SZ-18]AUC13799.1 hypothetical protein BTO06_00935 [Tenacibaculum sp. SZ-18]
MKKKKKNFIIVFIILNIILISWIIIHNDYCFEKIIKYAKELAVFEFSAISLIIAVSLFDQFGLNKKLTEKRVELIIELLTELKKQEGFGSHFKINGEFMSNPSFYFEKNMVENHKKRFSKDDFFKKILNTQIVINSTDFDNGFQNVRKVINNPIMPKSIVEKAQFLGISGGMGGSKLNESNELLYLYFTSEGKKELVKKETKYWLFKENNNCTLIEFLKKFDNLFAACEDWTNKHSNIDEELNLKNF